MKEQVTDFSKDVSFLSELQDEPFAGDVINPYNDREPEPGVKPLGPFYELETSSSAAELEPGESKEHVQYTFHFEGDEEELNKVALSILGVSLNDIKTVFK